MSEHDARVKELLCPHISGFKRLFSPNDNTFAACCGTQVFDKEGILWGLSDPIKADIRLFRKKYGREPEKSERIPRYFLKTEGFQARLTENHMALYVCSQSVKTEEKTGIARIFGFVGLSDKEILALVPNMRTYNVHKYETHKGPFTLLWKDC